MDHRLGQIDMALSIRLSLFYSESNGEPEKALDQGHMIRSLAEKCIMV